MPITYDQPGPFAPGIAAEYGAAMQFSQDAPSIIGAVSRAAQMRQENDNAYAGRELQRQMADASSQDRRAALYTGSSIAQANRDQSAIEHTDMLNNRMDLQTLEGQQRVEQMNVHAANQQWLNQQDLDARDRMRLQVQKASIAAVNESKLPQEVKDREILKLRSGVDELEGRMKASMAREHEMKGTMMEDAAKRQQATRMQLETIEADAKKRGVGVLTLQDPATGQPHVFFQDPKTGAWTNPFTGGAKAAEPKPFPAFSQAEINKAAEEEAKVNVGIEPPLTSGGKGEGESDEHKAWRTRMDEEFRRAAHRMEDDYRAKSAQHNGQPPPPRQWNEKGERISEAAAAKTEDKMNNASANFASQVQQLMARTDLPAEIKGPVVRDLAGAATAIKNAGSYGELSKEQKKFVNDTIKAFNDLPKPPPPPPPGAAPMVPGSPPAMTGPGARPGGMMGGPAYGRVMPGQR